MFLSLFSGQLIRYVLSPIGLILSLALLLRMKAVQIQVKNIPSNFMKAMEAALLDTPYQNSLSNWLAVSKMESAGYKSSLYVKHNNPWGMRPSKVRKHTQSGSVMTSNGEFATYASIEEAAEDILLYMQARKYPTGLLSLYDWVVTMQQKTYFTGETIGSYYGKVKAWLDR